MFRHQGKSRAPKHNIGIATVLSFVAGIVNVTGFLAIQRFTTNITGHFAFFINDVSKFELLKGLVFFMYIFSFLFGSFLSSTLIELFKGNKKLNIYVFPTLIESSVLILVAVLADFAVLKSPDVIACLLLFAMGVQNSFVTKISNAVVRTTHLTGIFTDLGIELSHMLFPKEKEFKTKTISTIKLRLYIIGFFFFGGIFGGILYTHIKLNSLIIGALILILGLIYDDLKFRMKLMRREYRKKRLKTI